MTPTTLPKVPKSYFVAAVGLAVAAFSVWHFLKKRNVENAAVMAGDATKGAKIDSIRAAVLADQITAANAGLGTDEEAIYSVFRQIENRADLNALISAFGEKRLDFTLYETSLGGYLRDTMSAGEVEKINDILKAKGINFAF